uniref:Uncharacterized protein n=1 Tax=viral metagenome TaxID=1070528 RepID=A0A6M3L2H5_9ZZZZ
MDTTGMTMLVLLCSVFSALFTGLGVNAWKDREIEVLKDQARLLGFANVDENGEFVWNVDKK